MVHSLHLKHAILPLARDDTLQPMGKLLVSQMPLRWATRERREKEERRCRFVCNICGGPYLDRTRDDITECPNCGALNERLGLSDL